jgi:carbon storage regulator
MLVLTRKTGEAIVIDGGIRVTVSAIKGDRVKIAITAPPHVKVDRSEVAARIAAEQADATEDTVLEFACR